jgi:hypothetical protein
MSAFPGPRFRVEYVTGGRKKSLLIGEMFSCGPKRIRTADLCIANALLYQLSYRPFSHASQTCLYMKILA